MSATTLGFTRTFPELSFDAARQQVEAALQKEGFGVLTEIDVKATLKKKLDVDFQRYTILGACNPTLAHQALEKNPEVGLLLPCNVVLAEDPDTGGTRVSIVDPQKLVEVVPDAAALEALTREARSRLERVLEHLEAATKSGGVTPA